VNTILEEQKKVGAQDNTNESIAAKDGKMAQTQSMFSNKLLES